MADYKQMYFTLLRASEQAVSALIQAQQECEEMFLSAPSPQLQLLPGLPDSQDP